MRVKNGQAGGHERHGQGRVFALSLLGMALASATGFALALTGSGAREDKIMWLLLLGAMALTFGYGLVAALSAWRAQNRRMEELQAALEALEKARQRAEEALEARSRLLAVITHELRTPMNGVIGMAGLLRETPLTPEQRSYVGAIEASGRALLSIVDELLDTARSDSSEIDLDIAPFQVDRLVEDVCELMSSRAHARGIDLACYVDPALEAPLLGDAGRIRQVLLNLIGNGIRFTDRGGVLVRVETAAIGDGRTGVRFEVRDTGIGIGAADLQRIFLAWEQGENSAGRGGSGLGLSISKRLVERLGGRLEVRSKPGRGSSFGFTLPLVSAAADSGRRERASVEERPLEGRRVRLLVPDSPRREALAAYVHAYGGMPVMADTDEAGLAEEAAGADLVVCDAAYADALRAALARADAVAGRTWLLLRPEQRRELADLMAAPELRGWLITPVRRSTFVAQIVEASVMASDDGGETVVAPGRERERPGPSSTAGGGRRVLLVEDNPVNATLARAILERAGHEVIHATDGEAALAFLRRALVEQGGAGWPHAVLMDVHMPGMDGLETTARLRQLERQAGLSRTPVLALTAGNSPAERERCLAAGMDGFLAKPFEPQQLKAALAAADDRHTAA